MCCLICVRRCELCVACGLLLVDDQCGAGCAVHCSLFWVLFVVAVCLSRVTC